MSRLALLWALTCFGCGHDPGARAPESLTQIQWAGAAPHVAVQLAGSSASGELQAQCDAAAARTGVVLDGNAATQAILTLDPGGNRLDLLSQRRGVVHSEKRPALPIERLCAQAAVAAASVLRDEQSGSPLDSESNTYAITPVRSQDLHSPMAHGAGPEPDPREPASQKSSGPLQ